MYVVLDQAYLPHNRVADVQAVAEETTKTAKGLLRFVYSKTQKHGGRQNTIAEAPPIYYTEHDPLHDGPFWDLPEEYIKVVE